MPRFTPRSKSPPPGKLPGLKAIDRGITNEQMHTLNGTRLFKGLTVALGGTQRFWKVLGSLEWFKNLYGPFQGHDAPYGEAL